MRIGLVVLPTDRWKDARRQWEWADGVGFATAWTYDHIRWGGMPDGPWLAAIPVLAAATAVTERIRLGTLVATPNFRHPVVLARDVIALDDLSDGRFDLGVGPGTEGPDAQALGQDPWPLAERMDRYGEFVQLKPPFSLHTALLWLTPIGILVIGACGLAFASRRREPAGPELTAAERARVSQILADKDV